MSPLKGGAIDFLHLKHGLHGATCFGWIGVSQKFTQDAWDNLPGQTKLVLEPSTLAGLATIGQKRVPEIIHFRLVITMHEQRNCFIKFIHRTAVEDHELLPF